MSYFELNPQHTDPARMRREREKARALKKSHWWRTLVSRGVCHYCDGRFLPDQLTMDHVVPLARGGQSTKGNIVSACRSCNEGKKLETPVEEIFRQLEEARAAVRDSSEIE